MSDRRKYRRLYFQPRDDVKAIFSIPGSNKTFEAQVLNISINGMAISPIGEDKSLFQTGSKIVMNEIKGNVLIRFKGEVVYEVRWAHQIEGFTRYCVGLEIIQTPIKFTDILGNLIYG